LADNSFSLPEEETTNDLSSRKWQPIAAWFKAETCGTNDIVSFHVLAVSAYPVNTPTDRWREY
jgi:hypothetical protein